MVKQKFIDYVKGRYSTPFCVKPTKFIFEILKDESDARRTNSPTDIPFNSKLTNGALSVFVGGVPITLFHNNATI